MGSDVHLLINSVNNIIFYSFSLEKSCFLERNNWFSGIGLLWPFFLKMKQIQILICVLILFPSGSQIVLEMGWWVISEDVALVFNSLLPNHVKWKVMLAKLQVNKKLPEMLGNYKDADLNTMHWMLSSLEMHYTLTINKYSLIYYYITNVHDGKFAYIFRDLKIKTVVW